MENQVKSKSFIVNNGLILGVATILLSVTTYAVGMHLEPHWSVEVVSYIIFIGLIIFGIKKFKEANGNFLSFGQAVKIGVGIGVLAGLIASVYQYIFMTYIEPEYMTQLTEIANQKLLEQGISEEDIDAANAMTDSFKSPSMVVAMGIIVSAIGGFIVSAIAGAIMKKSAEE